MYPPKNKNLSFYLHLALFTCTKLIFSTLRSVGTPAHYLHTAYTKLHTTYTKYTLNYTPNYTQPALQKTCAMHTAPQSRHPLMSV